MFEASGVRVEALAPSGRKVLRRGKRQILLIAAAEQVFAVAARCPHEGYPLSEGTLSEAGPGSEAGAGGACLLTCDWHNWKFDLATGAAVVGRDPVRTFPVQVRQGEIFLDLADPPPDLLARKALAGLEAAMDDDDPARMAREAARLERSGVDARGALVHAIHHTAGRLEGGMTHAHAAAADWLALRERAPGADQRLAALVEPIAHLAWDTLGAGQYPYPETVLPWHAGAFLSAMEAEDEVGAIGRLRGALAEGMVYADLRPTLSEAALAHYADFGHSAIYVFKAGQLIDRLGAAATEPILIALTRQLIYARREDRLPEFRAYGSALARWGEGGGKAVTARGLSGQPVKRVLERLCAAADRPVREIYDTLVGAAAWNMLHFDARLDQAAGPNVADAVGWLDFTHALTFANAARHLSAERPDLWGAALLQLGLFVGRNRAYVDADQDVSVWEVAHPKAFLSQEMARLYDHGVPEPIIACHRLKVLFALEDELAAAPAAPWAPVMCAAVNRYLNTPMKRRHSLRLARQARAFAAREG
jgi:nitrite reductase/ring-hydroxylating ferredoxin subunit